MITPWERGWQPQIAWDGKQCALRLQFDQATCRFPMILWPCHCFSFSGRKGPFGLKLGEPSLRLVAGGPRDLEDILFAVASATAPWDRSGQVWEARTRRAECGGGNLL